MGNKKIILAVLILLAFCLTCAQPSVRRGPGALRLGGPGVWIHIDHVDDAGEYAKISIGYDGVVTRRGKTKSPEIKKGRRSLKILVIPTRLRDNPDIPGYATFDWMKNMMFGEGVGPDDRGVQNSVKNYFKQVSYGKVNIIGDVYNKWVTIGRARQYQSTEKKYNMPTRMVQDAIDGLDPRFMEKTDYDFAVCLMAGGLWPVYKGGWYEQISKWEDREGNFKGYLIMDIPVEKGSRYDRVIEETVVSTNHEQLRTTYNVRGVEGVWLARGGAGRGINYFTGGKNHYPGNGITLGRRLPGKNVSVVVRYNTTRITMASRQHEDRGYGLRHNWWYGSFIHELVHGIGPYITLTGVDHVGDLYQAPYELIKEYGLMSGGNHNSVEGYCEPAHLSGYTKMKLGYISPYQVPYGSRRKRVTLTMTEGEGNDVKLIKIPIRPEDDVDEVSIGDRDFAGQEYLLLEWRKKGGISRGHNFDSGLPHEGLIVYHVIEAEPDRHGNDRKNTVRIVDATPWTKDEFEHRAKPVLAEQSSLYRSSAAFGPSSGVYEYAYRKRNAGRLANR